MRACSDLLRAPAGWVVASALVAVLGCGEPAAKEFVSEAGGAGAAHAAAHPDVVLRVLEPFTAQRLQAVAFGADGSVWMSGLNGVWGVYGSRVGGVGAEVPELSRHGSIAGASTLQLRDLDVVGDAVVALSAGVGDASRIYRSTDAGSSWREVWRNHETEAFYNCIDFLPARQGAPALGLLFGDSLPGLAAGETVAAGERSLFRSALSADGGETWQPLELPPAVPGEGGFAASGQCVLAVPPSQLWIATGAAPRPRLLHSEDAGRTWKTVATPFAGGSAAGIFALAAAPDGRLVAAGGSLELGSGEGETGAAGDAADAANAADTGASAPIPLVAVTDAQARAWQVVMRSQDTTAPPGARFGVAVDDRGSMATVGPGGITWSSSLEAPPRRVSERAAWSVAARGDEFWVVGPEGFVAVLHAIRSP